MIKDSFIFFSLFIFLFFGCSPEDKVFESTIPFKSLNSDQTGIDFSNSLLLIAPISLLICSSSSLLKFSSKLLTF